MSGDKVALLCHIGGEFVREEGKVYYKGGTVRLIHVDRTINHEDLLKRLHGLHKPSVSTLFIKYKHPDIGFDSPFISPLVAVEDENDLCNMMEVYSGPKPTIPFYMSTREASSRTAPLARCYSGVATPWFAANGEQIQATPPRREISPNTSPRADRGNITLGFPYSIERSHDQHNDSTPTAIADVRKQLIPTSKTPGSDRRMDHDSDSSVATGNELGSEELNSTIFCSRRELDCNKTNSRREIQSIDITADVVPVGVIELAGNPGETVHSPKEGSLLKKGLEFENADALRRALTEASIVEKFGYKPVRTTSRCITAICLSKSCKWRLHAIRIRGSAIFKIKKFNPVHTCGESVVPQNHPNARVRFVADFILDRLRQNLDYKPKDIIADIHGQFGVKVSYHKAWRGRKQALGKILGSYEESLMALPAFCREVERANPKSVLHLQCDSGNSFQRLFIALYASIRGFLLGCRPLLVFKGINIQGKYPSVLLVAMAVDANGGDFPLAYSIVESENIDSWGWFLSWLRQALEREFGNSLKSVPWLTVISEEKESLIQGVQSSFPGAYLGLCVSEITQRIAKWYNDSAVKEYIWAAARAYTKVDYDHYIEEIRKINIRAYEWIMSNLKPKDWATSYFEGQRYNVLTSDIGRSFTSWISETRDMTILSIVQEMHSRLVAHFSRQRELGMQMQSAIVPNVQSYLHEKSKEALGYKAQHVNTTEWEVVDTKGSNFFVNLSQNTCTCYEWQVEGLPCSHAVAVIQLDRLDVSQFCQPWFMAVRFQMAYSEDMHPIPDLNEWNYQDIFTVRPPLAKRGRPRASGNVRDVSDAYKQCGACKKPGHNKRTCTRQQLVVARSAES